METGEEGVRMRKVIKALVVVALVNAAATTIGRLISKQNSAGDEDSADFRRMVMFGGEEFKSKAIALRSGAVTVRGGGISLDLRDAGLDPDGAALDLDVRGGGALVLVPENWIVTVEEESSMGGVETDVTPPGSLPAGAPHLTVHASARGGGIAIKTRTL